MASEQARRFALCIHVEADEELQERKVYEVLPDDLAARQGHLRVVDDSGDDYLYPAATFIFLELPEAAKAALTAAASSSAKEAR